MPKSCIIDIIRRVFFNIYYLYAINTLFFSILPITKNGLSVMFY